MKSKVQSPKSKVRSKSIGWLMLAAGLVQFGWVAFAELTATVMPGYQLGTGEVPTIDKLNQGFTPVVEISGTVDGTTGLSAGSVNGSHLADTVVDDRTINFTNTSPRALQVKLSGIGVGEISTAIAGDGLTGGGGSALAVSVNSVSLQILNDTLYGKTVTGYLSGGGTNNTTTNIALATFTAGAPNVLIITNSTLAISNVTFTSFEYTISDGLLINTNHNLGAAPMFVRWVMVCKTADLNYAPGDEVDVASWFHSSGPIFFAMGANATNVFLQVRENADAQMRAKGTGTATDLTESRWRAKCYARP